MLGIAGETLYGSSIDCPCQMGLSQEELTCGDLLQNLLQNLLLQLYGSEEVSLAEKLNGLFLELQPVDVYVGIPVLEVGVSLSPDSEKVRLYIEENTCAVLTESGYPVYQIMLLWAFEA